MSRYLTGSAATQAQAQFHTLIVMGKFEFDDPVYAHTGIGEIVYDGNTYVGVGEFGSIGESRESENIGPMQMDISLAAPNGTYMGEALEAGTYGDAITLYAAYRDSAGGIVEDPWVIWSGWYEFATVRLGDSNVVTISGQHDLSVLNEIDGSRFTDEDQQARFTGDVAFEHIHRMATTKLLWGGRVTRYERPPGPGGGKYEVP